MKGFILIGRKQGVDMMEPFKVMGGYFYKNRSSFGSLSMIKRGLPGWDVAVVEVTDTTYGGKLCGVTE